MPTQVTTDMRRSPSQIQKSNEVNAASRSEARQALYGNEQSMPSAKESGQTSNQHLEQVAENMNKHVQSMRRDLHFSVDEDTGETVIRVIDSESQKTIRTIPSEEFLSVAQHLNQTVGMLLNAEA